MITYLKVVGTLFAIMLIGYGVYSQPSTVTLSDDKWECAVAVTKGIETACTNYRVK